MQLVRWDQSAAKIENSAIISTTGGFTWPAARRLASFIEAEHVGLSTSFINILELGAGTGWLGITIALHMPRAHLLLTEHPEGLDHLSNNVTLNRDALGDRVSVSPCDWRDYQLGKLPGGSRNSLPIGPLAPMNNRPWDLIIGSDLVYVEQGAIDLPRVLAATASRDHTKILYCHTKHRFDYFDIRLGEEMEKNGLIMREVIEDGSELAPPSPPPLTELFPDQRIAVYDISRKQDISRPLVVKIDKE